MKSKKYLVLLVFLSTYKCVFCNYAEDIFYNVFAVTQTLIDSPFKILNKALTSKFELPNMENFKLIIFSIAFSFLFLALIKHAIDLFSNQETVQTRWIAIRILISYFAIISSVYIIEFLDSIFYLFTSSISPNQIDHFIDMEYYMQSIITSNMNIFSKGLLLTISVIFSVLFSAAIFFIIGQIFIMTFEKLIYQIMFPIYLSFLGSGSTEERTKSAIKNYISINVNIILMFMQITIIGSFFSGQARIAIRNIIKSLFNISSTEIDKFLDVFLAVLGVTSLFFAIYILYKFPNIVKGLYTLAKERQALKKEEKEREKKAKEQKKEDKKIIKKQNKKDKEKLKELRKDELKIKIAELMAIIRGNKIKLFNFRKPLEVAEKLSEIYGIIRLSHFEVSELKRCLNLMEGIKKQLKKVENKASFNYLDRKKRQMNFNNEIRKLDKSINEKLKKANMLNRLSGKRKDLEKEAMLLNLELKELKEKAKSNKKIITLDKIKNKVVADNLKIQLMISKIAIKGINVIPNKLGHLNQGIVNEMLSVKRSYDWSCGKEEIEDAYEDKEITQEEMELFFNIKDLEELESKNQKNENKLLETFLEIENEIMNKVGKDEFRKNVDISKLFFEENTDIKELKDIGKEIEGIEKEIIALGAVTPEQTKKLENLKELISNNKSIPEKMKLNISSSINSISNNNVEHKEAFKYLTQEIKNVITEKQEIFNQNITENIKKIKELVHNKDMVNIEKIEKLEKINMSFIESNYNLKNKELIVEANYIKVELKTLETMKENLKNNPDKFDKVLIESCIKTKEVELKNVVEKLDLHSNNINSFNIENKIYKEALYEQEDSIKQVENYSLEILDRRLSYSEKNNFELSIMKERKDREIKIESNSYSSEIAKIEKIYEIKEKIVISEEEKTVLKLEKEKEIAKIEVEKNIKVKEISDKYNTQIEIKQQETKQYKMEEMQKLETKNNEIKKEILKYQKEARALVAEISDLKEISDKQKNIEMEIAKKAEELKLNQKKVIEYQQDISKIDMLDRKRIQDNLREELKKDKAEKDNKLIQELQVKLNNFYETEEENLTERNRLELQLQQERQQYVRVNQQSRKNRDEIIRARKIKEQAEKEFEQSQYYTQELSKRIKKQETYSLLGDDYNFGLDSDFDTQENSLNLNNSFF